MPWYYNVLFLCLIVVGRREGILVEGLIVGVRVGFEVVGLRVVGLAVGLRVVGLAVFGFDVGVRVVGLKVLVGVADGELVGCRVVGLVFDGWDVGVELGVTDGCAKTRGWMSL